MSYYRKNGKKSRIEIYFDEKISKSLKEDLENNNWEYYPPLKCWCNRNNSENEEFARKVCNVNALIGKKAKHKEGLIIIDRRNDTSIKKPESAGSKISLFQDNSYLKNRTKMKSFLSDLFLGDKLKINVCMAAYDMGIIEVLDTSDVITEFIKWSLCKRLTSQYGLSLRNAEIAVCFWIKEYGKKHLGKSVDCSVEVTLTKNEQDEDRLQIERTKKNTIIIPNKNPINISSFGKGDKLPKEVIRRNITVEKMFGIDSFNVSLFKSFQYDSYMFVDIVGEIWGKALFEKRITLLSVAHNDRGEPIGMNSNVGVKRENFERSYSFNTIMTLPTDEMLSDVSFRFILDPVFS